MSSASNITDSFSIRHTVVDDLPAIMEIYSYARSYMALHGNPRQWGLTNWPPEQLIREDIAAGRSYVCLCGDRIAATFCYIEGAGVEPTYAKINEGSWKSPEYYGVIHRIASAADTHGAGGYCIEWAFARCGCMRIDTHPDNLPMQRLLEKHGFTRCGVIYVEEDNDPRYAFERFTAEAE